MNDFNLKDILDLLRQRASRPLSLKEIQGMLDLSAGERKALGKTLKNLVREGSLVQLKGGRFALPKKVNLVVGPISVHRDGYGFVTPAQGGGDVFVPARHVRPAMHGDLVVVRLERSIHSKSPEGRVIRVEQRAHDTVAGLYQKDQGVGFVTPVDPHLQDDILIPPDQARDARAGEMVLVKITSYPGRNRAAVGMIQDVLGDPADPQVEIRVAAIRFDLPYEFPEDVLDEAETVAGDVREGERSGREDLTAENFFTIDGESAKDFDDAVAIERLPAGYRLKVAIADVAHYVEVGSAIDREALSRGTSVYFPGSCLPMLPEILSNGICSLNPGVDRLVQVAEIDFDANGKRTGSRFYQGVIQSKARLTYTRVAQCLSDEDPEALQELSPQRDDLQVMRELAERLIARREQRGSLDFDLPEAQIDLDLQGRPENIVRAERTLAHRLIEEFMLAANEAVATWLVAKGQPMIFRVHEAPAEGKMDAFQEFIAHFNQGLSIPPEGIKPKLLQALLERVAGRPEEDVINHVLLRSLPQAYYTTHNQGHFGLAADCYCHFTSPIRRYPDLVVHRILKQQLGSVSRKKADDRMSLEDIARQASRTERRAMDAERDIVKLKKCQYIADKVGEKYAGMVTSVQSFGFFVELNEIFVEGLVHISSLDDDFYQFEEERHRLIGMNRRREFTIGTPVQVTVEKVDLERREIDFHLTDDGMPNRGRRKTKSGKRIHGG